MRRPSRTGSCAALKGRIVVRPAVPWLGVAGANEIDHLRSMGYGKLLTYEDILVFGPDGVIQNTLRFPDEPVRHKMLDLIGDLVLLNRDLRGRIVAVRSGHKLNQELVRKLRERR